MCIGCLLLLSLAKMVLGVFLDGFCLSDWSTDKRKREEDPNGDYWFYIPVKRKRCPLENPLYSDIRASLCQEK